MSQKRRSLLEISQQLQEEEKARLKLFNNSTVEQSYRVSPRDDNIRVDAVPVPTALARDSAEKPMGYHRTMTSLTPNLWRQEPNVSSEQAECASGSTHADFRPKDSLAPFADKQDSLRSMESVLKSETASPTDTNANKQHRYVSEPVEAFFPRSTESFVEFNNYQFHSRHESNIDEKECPQNVPKSENKNENSHPVIGDETDDSRTNELSVEKEKSIRRRNMSLRVSREESSLKQQPLNSDNLSHHASDNTHVQPHRPDTSVSESTDQESTKHDLTVSFSESCNEVFTLDFEKGSIGCRCDQLNDSEIHTERTNAESSTHSDYKVPDNSYSIGKSGMIPHQILPDLCTGTPRGGHVPHSTVNTFEFQGTDTENVYPDEELLFDDSFFPTQHKLATSEDLNAAMMQARRRQSYGRPRDTRPDAKARYGFALDSELQTCHDRFIPTTRGDLQLKYRQIMSIISRRSFNRWWAETSARAGDWRTSYEKEDVSFHPSWEKIMSVGCPGCLGYNMSNKYGKPCHCQNLPKQTKARSHAPKKVKVRNKLRGGRLPDKSVQSVNNHVANLPKQRPELAECKAFGPGAMTQSKLEGRSLVKTALLSDPASKPRWAADRSTATTDANTLQHIQNLHQYNKMAVSPDEPDVFFETVKSEGETRSFDQLSTDTDNLSVLHQDKRTMPTREWEIRKLERALKTGGNQA